MVGCPGWQTADLSTTLRSGRDDIWWCAPAARLWSRPGAEDFDEGLLLEGLDAVLQTFYCIAFEDGAAELEDNRTGIDVLRDLVDGAAGFRRAGVQHGLVDSAVHQAAEGGQQRGVNVEQAAAPLLDEVGADDAHVADHEDEIGTGFLEGARDLFVVDRAIETLGVEEEGVDAGVLRAVEDGRVGLVGVDKGEVDVRQLVGGEGVEDALEGGSTGGAEHAHAEVVTRGLRKCD